MPGAVAKKKRSCIWRYLVNNTAPHKWYFHDYDYYRFLNSWEPDSSALLLKSKSLQNQKKKKRERERELEKERKKEFTKLVRSLQRLLTVEATKAFPDRSYAVFWSVNCLWTHSLLPSKLNNWREEATDVGWLASSSRNCHSSWHKTMVSKQRKITIKQKTRYRDVLHCKHCLGNIKGHLRNSQWTTN